MFSRSDLQILDPIELIRKHPEMYLAGGEVSGEALVGRLISDLLVTPYRLAIALRVDAWWVVACNEDWMASSDGGPHCDPFKQIVPFAEAGPNAMRAEILIAAFSKDVITFAGPREQKVMGEGDDKLLKLVRQHPEWRRCVAFRL